METTPNTPSDRPRLREINAGRRFNPKPRHLIISLATVAEKIELALEATMGVAAVVIDRTIVTSLIEGALEEIFYGAIFTGEATFVGQLSTYGIPRQICHDLLDEIDVAVQTYLDRELGGRDSANDYSFRLMSTHAVVLTESQPVPQFRRGHCLKESLYDEYNYAPSL